MRLFTPEWRAKISAANKGRRRDPIIVAKVAQMLRGRKHGPLSEEHKAKLRAAKVGKRLSAEHRAKISASTVGRPKTKEHIEKVRQARLGRSLVEANPNNLSRYQIERRRHLKREYGLTEDQVAAILAYQGGCCAICRKSDHAGVNWHVDHCHKTGAIRGVLCFRCNTLLGNALDKIETLTSAIAYLESKC